MRGLSPIVALVSVALVSVALGACTADPAPPAAWTWRLPGELPMPRVPLDNPMSADKVELGRYLFYDTRLSADGTQACATCHVQARAFTDGLVVPVGITGEAGRHNAMSLANIAYNSSNTWAGNVTRLEAQARGPMFGTQPIELGLAGGEQELLARLADEPVYQELFPRAFSGAEPISVDNVTAALASFERTMLSGSSPFDRFVAGDTAALDTSAQRGLALFESDRLGCTHCHGGFNLASSYDHAAMAAPQIQFFNTGLYNVDGNGAYPPGDRGVVEVTGDPAHMGRFRAPTLRNIALTAPYFHDGSAATLADVIASYARGGRLVADGPSAGDGATSPLKSPFVTGFTLTIDEQADLIAFLSALTDRELVEDPALASPW
jgi:cytochrome c peroxidase